MSCSTGGELRWTNPRLHGSWIFHPPSGNRATNHLSCLRCECLEKHVYQWEMIGVHTTNEIQWDSLIGSRRPAQQCSTHPNKIWPNKPALVIWVPFVHAPTYWSCCAVPHGSSQINLKTVLAKKLHMLPGTRNLVERLINTRTGRVKMILTFGAVYPRFSMALVCC